MSKFETDVFPEHLLSDRFKSVFRHWNDIRGDRQMPARSDIDPMEIRSALPCIWIYERADDGVFRCRLAGEEINTANGRSIQGLTAREIIGPKFDQILSKRWAYILDTPAIFHGNTTNSPARRVVERMCLPLSDAEGNPRFNMGVTDYYDVVPMARESEIIMELPLHVAFYTIPDLQRIYPKGLEEDYPRLGR
ncbi:PAS domain-containing protein [Hwanghaeella grinnelliae]|uniref:PAS domain-containing protein n=1 Tax=Hwanghaeella grinnelliae TaxID=2500179 RepID=A0A437QJT1_9PROT|nr:PAS domain-containing protein [Hwanghaeella grinnelliae]RVU34767.1 PAS domain-containing protein [Hwanghaeella grinnelliae]